jgi:rod shape-determining protein MreD
MEAVVETRGSGIFVIALSILLAMVLAIVPMPYFVPAELGYLRPDWVALVMTYWIIALPHRVGIMTAWFIGFIMDILLGSLLGQHALAFVVIAYVAASLYQRLRMFSVWQQALVVFAILGINELINFWAESIAGLTKWSTWHLLPALTGALLWPWIFLMLRSLRRRFGVT